LPDGRRAVGSVVAGSSCLRWMWRTQAGAIAVFLGEPDVIDVNYTAVVVINNAAIAGNFAAQNGGGIHLGRPQIALNNSIVYFNKSNNSATNNIFNSDNANINETNPIDIDPGYIVPPKFDADRKLTNCDTVPISLHKTNTTFYLH